MFLPCDLLAQGPWGTGGKGKIVPHLQELRGKVMCYRVMPQSVL